MDRRDLLVEVRDVSLNRVGTITHEFLSMKATLRFCNVGEWEITLPADHPMIDYLIEPGSGLVVTLRDDVLFSGSTTNPLKKMDQENPDGTFTFRGVTDEILLADALAYPDVATDDVSAQAETHDVRSGDAETILREYVAYNIGSLAAPGRIDGLRSFISLQGTNNNFGSTVQKSARFDNLLALCYEIAIQGGVRYRMVQRGSEIIFEVSEIADRTAEVRFDIQNGTVTSQEIQISPPGATRVIVAGQGEGVDRTFIQRTSTDSLTGEAEWGRVIEVFKDQRNSADLVELEGSGDEILLESGFSATNVKIATSDDTTMLFNQDWYLGDSVTVVVNGQETSTKVTTAALLANSDAVMIGAGIGDVTGFDKDAALVQRVEDIDGRVKNLEVSEAGGAGTGAASLLQQEVKNDQGASVTKGQAVYGSGANGTNFLVKLAQANAESTSSKTIGLLAQDLAVNGIGQVITEGILTGIDTSAGTAGDPVWLSPSTPGGRVYGVANKPVAPNHMVFLGFVIRSSSTNGEIQVKIQNGFELDELHDVKITSKANRDLIAYDSTNSVWANTPAATFGVVPTGAMMMWYTNTAPTGWQICDGSAAATSALAAIVGANVPNLKGKIPVGLDSSQTEFDVLGETGGAKSITLAESNLPAHTHSFSATVSDTHNHTVPNRTIVPGSTSGNFFESWSSGGSTSRTHTTSSDTHTHTVSGTTGSGNGTATAISNLQPYIVINYIIKT